ncbi:spermine oxidase [Lepeophtheirus salmonis]|uniref:spermine oxidase n=1 Tax=Lepeophtheirus salmonis TaxID=72036 RepID=UPI001AE4636E|nr:spermine oxidase-like [Lepeophtheirus salmonis]XP_040567184.1 spermine oxidase-like [Lepeophtheirus salmonis]
MVRVLILGGGVSGLSTANFLAEKGLRNIVILEARNRVGGRIYTDNVDGIPLEYGSQWIHGTNPANSVYNFINKSGLSLEYNTPSESIRSFSSIIVKDQRVGTYLRSDGIPIPEHVRKLAEEFHSETLLSMKNDAENIPYDENKSNIPSVAQYYTTKLEAKEKELKSNGHSKRNLEDFKSCLNGLKNGLSIYIGEKLDACKIDTYGSFEELPGKDAFIPKGLSNLQDKLLNKMKHNVTIKLNHIVEKIIWTREAGHNVIINVKRKEKGDSIEISADFVVCTFPLGVLKVVHQEMFQPNLPPGKIRAINNIGFGSVVKLFLSWSEPWWNPSDFPISLAWKQSEMEEDDHWSKSITAFYTVPRHPGMLMAWIPGATAAKTVESLRGEEITLVMGCLLRQFTGDPSISFPDRVYYHPWTSDKFTLGAYAFSGSADDFEEMSAPLPNANNPKLFFAGEATISCYRGTMHGARSSGMREAQRIVEKCKFLKGIK